MEKKIKILFAFMILIISGILLSGENENQENLIQYKLIPVPEEEILNILYNNSHCSMNYYDTHTYNNVDVDISPDELAIIEKEFKDLAPNCPLSLFDISDGNTIDISYIYVGVAKSPDEAVMKWTENVEEIEKKYKNIYQDCPFSLFEIYDELYGNFLWDKNPDEIKLKYRSSKEGYEREGWYITTYSSNLDSDNCDFGQFFLSNEGLLMPVNQVCTTLCCP